MENSKTTRPSSRTPEEITNYITQWQQSGKSKKSFCLESGLNYMTFIGWSSKKHLKKKENVPGFVQVKVAPKTSRVFAEIRTAQGFVISLHREVPADYLRNLLRS